MREINRARGLPAALWHDACGTTAVLFALLLLPLVAVMLLAIDYNRATGVQSELRAATDAAAEAGARHLGQPRDAVTDAVRSSLDADLRPALKGTPMTLEIADDDSRLTLRLDKKVELSLAGVLGLTTVDASAERVIARPTPSAVGGGAGGPGPDVAGERPAAAGQSSGAGSARTGLDDAIARAGQEAGVSAAEIRAAQEMARQLMRDMGAGDRMRALMGN